MRAVLSRRRALELLGLGAGAAAACRVGPRSREAPAGPILDFHVHLMAAAARGSYLSRKQKAHVNYRFFLRLLDLREGPGMDEAYVDRLVAQVRASSVKRALLLAEDCRYDSAGRPEGERSTPFYVPNDYVLEVVARHPDVFLPCVSINPQRRDAVDELERCVARGARILKIHPPIMGVDPAERRFRPFFRRCSDLRVVVTVHTGTEKAAAIVTNEFSGADRLAPALEEGCTVVAAHACMSSFYEKEDFFPGLVEAVRRFPRLYCDTSNLVSMLRWPNLPRALATPEVRERLVYGSDFPFPSNALVFWDRMRPATTLRLLSETNLIERSYRLQLALGLPRAAFERGARLIEG